MLSRKIESRVAGCRSGDIGGEVDMLQCSHVKASSRKKLATKSFYCLWQSVDIYMNTFSSLLTGLMCLRHSTCFNGPVRPKDTVGCDTVESHEAFTHHRVCSKHMLVSAGDHTLEVTRRDRQW